ncbi:MAG: hypothetical protein HQM09_01545 [Candidatus Riflebacteria bacterium]|nr:hypothetical protein [Candidatus Riflebacteria bacterium]
MPFFAPGFSAFDIFEDPDAFFVEMPLRFNAFIDIRVLVFLHAGFVIDADSEEILSRNLRNRSSFSKRVGEMHGIDVSSDFDPVSVETLAQYAGAPLATSNSSMINMQLQQAPHTGARGVLVPL